MFRTMKSLVIGVSLTFAGVALAQGKPADKAAPPASKPADKPADKGGGMPPTKTSRTPVSNLKWEKLMGPQGPELAIIYGDPKTGPYGAFMKLAPGTKSGWHTHDYGYTSIVVQGTHTHLNAGEKSGPALPAGSWFSQAAKENHHDECGKDGPCVLFIHSDGPMSFTPKTEDGKDVPATPPPAAAPKK
jgi:quercetin dioxygenase-like cupin family protein